MNDKFTNNMNREDEIIGQKLDRVANQTNISSQFASELEERLRIAHQPKMSWFASSFKQVSPALLWVGLVILMGLVLNWSIKSLIPAPQPAINNTPIKSDASPSPDRVISQTGTPVIQSGGYDWRGTKLYLDAPLPESPAEANVYLLKPDDQPTVEEARILAQQFGIEGEAYRAPGPPDTNNYIVTDGKQRLVVNFDMTLSYHADYSNFHFMNGSKNISQEEAASVIDSFLKAHSFDFQYQVEKQPQNPGLFYVVPLTEDGLPIRFDYNVPARMEFIVNEKGEVLLVVSNLISYEKVGPFGIKTAAEAFQQVLNSSETIQNGVLESMRSSGIREEIFWQRTYPDNETVTIYGNPYFYPSVEAGKPPLVTFDQYMVHGQIDGLDKLEDNPLIEATGQFSTIDGIRIFNVDSWTISDARGYGAQGSLVKKDGLVTMRVAGKDHVLPNAPEDVPLNTPYVEGQTSYLYVGGFFDKEDFIWQTIQYYPEGALNQGGGGGANGTGFYRLNLSGTPVQFPTPTLQPETNQGTVEYIIKEGDTLLGIAEAYGLTPEKIVQANSWLLDEHVLMPGNRLIIPVKQLNSQATEYVVRENDTLGSIALNFGITVDELMQANGIVSDMVFTGQTLFIPGQQTDNPYVGRRFEKQRGTLVINIYNQSDGSSREEFLFTMKNGDGSFFYALLENVPFQALLPYHHRPLDVWGTVNYVDENGIPVISVEKYEAPYPGLTFQLIQGTQESVELNGMPATIFTTDDGKRYVQMSSDGSPVNAIIGNIGDKVYAEVLLIPDEIFGGYPAMRIFNIGLAINPKNGEKMTITITADQPYVMDEVTTPENYIQPTATIEKVELVYYIPAPQRTPPNPNADLPYIQPAWRFYGHYSNGDEFEILVQALKQEYLLPELARYTPPG